jgi:ribosomal protein S12 methylthiotransferase accessory factor
MSHTHYINESKGSLRYVLTSDEYISSKTITDATPFRKDSFLTKLKIYCLKKTLNYLNFFFEQEIFFENKLKELASIDPKIRSLLYKFIDSGLIKTWTIDVITQTKSYIVGITIETSDFITKEGQKLSLAGANGCGTGYTINEAFLPALAEMLERQSSAIFDDQDLYFGSEIDLKNKNPLPLEKLSFFTKLQKEKVPELRKSVYDKNTKIYWKKGVDFITRKRILVPAQLIYIFMRRIKKNEPLFFETNSNGVAAHSTKDEASLRAILEVLERDSFLFSWLNKTPPAKINKASIKSLEIIKLIKNIEDQGFKLTILAATTEFGIPTIISVVTGSEQRSFVFVGTSCDFNPINALRKSLFEVARTSQFFPQASAEDLESAKIKYPFFTTFKERQAWWSIPENRKKIDFFLCGDEIDHENLSYPFSNTPTSTREKLKYLRNKASEKQVNIYLVDITSKEARDVGLFVMKATTPNLLPAYYKEYSCPLGHARVGTTNKFYSTPHPLL